MIFTRDLEIGMTHPDVLELQRMLNTDPATIVSYFGAGSRGQETSYFGSKTKAALAKFQVKHKISPALGYFGPITRGFINRNQLGLIPETIVKKVKELLGTDFTNDQIVPDEVSCAYAVTTLLNKIDPTVPIEVATYNLNLYFRNSGKFERIYAPEAGCFVICPTGTNTRPDIIYNGHVGVYIDDYHIVSNDSPSGLFIQNYDTDKWRKRYVDRGGFEVFLYRKVA